MQRLRVITGDRHVRVQAHHWLNGMKLAWNRLKRLERSTRVKAMGYLFGFKGRFSPLEWWFSQILAFSGAIFVAYLFVQDIIASGGSEQVSDLYLLIWANLFDLFLIFPCLWISFAATVKRFHDRGKSGAWTLVWFFPCIGPLWIIIECGFLEGMSEANEYDVPYSDQGGILDMLLNPKGGTDQDAQKPRPSDGYDFAKEWGVERSTATATAPRPSINPAAPRPTFGKR